MSWTENDYRHYYVILERKQGQGQVSAWDTNGDKSNVWDAPPSSPVNKTKNEQHNSNEWGNTTNEWDKPSSPPKSPTPTPTNDKDSNTWAAWPNNPPEPKPSASTSREFTVRDWARSPSPAPAPAPAASVWGDNTPSSCW